MRQYRDSRALLGGSILEGAGAATATSGSHYTPTSSDGVSAPHNASSHARSSSLGGGPGFPLTQPYRPLSAKERDAMRQRGEGGLGLVSALEKGEGDVVQHSDGGQIAAPAPPSGAGDTAKLRFDPWESLVITGLSFFLSSLGLGSGYGRGGGAVGAVMKWQ
jgi:hypothetical protein